MSKICPSCSNPNPPDHAFCHQCGGPLADRQEPQGHSPPAESPSVPRRPPDESRLPPPGSFRSGFYRLARALLINQGQSGYRPRGTAPSSVVAPSPVRDPLEGDGEAVSRSSAALPVEPIGEPIEPPPVVARPAMENSVLGEPLQAAAELLTRALLVRHALPRRANPPVRLPGSAGTRPIARFPAGRRMQTAGAGWRLPPAGLGKRLHGARRRVVAARVRVQEALVPGKELVIPRYVEVAAVFGLTLLALFLRAWNLPEAPVGIHGDETEMAMEALRSLRGESVGIWTGVTLGNPAGYVHWMALIFRLGGADVTTMRLASTIPGIAIIPVGYLLVRSLFPFRVAILSAVMLTVSIWFVIQSRIAFGGITSVFMALLAMWLIVAAVQSKRRWVAVVAGITLGLGLYSFKTFLLYYTGIWGVALLSMLINRELRWNRQIWLTLGLSAMVGAPILWFYATSGYIGPNLNDLYQVSLSSPSTWLKIPGLALDAALLAHLPIDGNSTDAPPSIPVLPLVAGPFFWAGLFASLLFMKQPRYRLLLAAWLIGMAPILIIPGVESRRYLLGIFFVLVIVAAGVDTVLKPVFHRLRQYLRERSFPATGAWRLATATVLIITVAYVALFSAPNLQEIERWGNSESVKWYFNYEYHESLLSISGLVAEHPVRYYTVRQPFDSGIRRFVLPGARGGDGAEEYGGDGVLPPADEISEDTIFVLLDKYLPLAQALEAQYAGAVKVGEGVEGGRTLYVAYLVPAQPEAG